MNFQFLNSFARHNPDYQVFMLSFTSYLVDEDGFLARILNSHPNIVLATVRLQDLFQDTPMEYFSKHWTYDQCNP